MLPGLLRLFGWWNRYSDRGRDIEGLDCATDYLKSSLDGAEIRVRIYRPLEAVEGPLPCMLYIHGGGYLIGSPEGADEVIKRFIDRRPCIVVAPDYRKAYDRPYPAGFQDCYDTLLWARDQAKRLGCRSDTFMVGGHSAGGGLTAAVSLKARDTGDVSIAFQMPFYPMIDDTQPEDSGRDIAPPVWNTSLNRKGWAGYHADIRRGRAEDHPQLRAGDRPGLESPHHPDCFSESQWHNQALRCLGPDLSNDSTNQTSARGRATSPSVADGIVWVSGAVNRDESRFCVFALFLYF